ncbi:hypothetical protein ABW20_dc0105637 [Dactylellina cionopaga]|nr:hypothetical protein ABW20_dc0105637 [Dactylellina cionopaga]
MSTQNASSFTASCDDIQVGDLVILQKRPCQIIRITTSTQTGQHLYLGVDVFTKDLVEEICVVTNPSPSITTHSLLTPAAKQYRVVDISGDKLSFQTNGGEIKTGIKIIEQGDLQSKIVEAFGRSPGAIRVLVISDKNGNELIVDYKTVHGDYKL